MEDTELHIAVRFGDLNDVEKALCQGLDPNKIGLYDWSPLHEATNNGDLGIVKLLLKFEGDPNAPDALHGFTAMHYAASQGNPECLRLLIGEGGNCKVFDHEGQSCLHVARGVCVEVLQSLSQIEVPAENDPRSQGKANSDTAADSQTEHELRSDGTSSIEPDTISIASDQSTSSTSSWNGKVLNFNEDLVMGHAVLSFEYNKKAKTFKIRVWELLDFLLPPVETSMIQDIYARSYLLPDKNKKTKRNTDSVSANKLSKSSLPKGEFHPVTIKFAKPLEYKDISDDMVNEKTVYLEIRTRQKYTWRSFVVASWNVPLSLAVKHLTKEKYPLTPKISTSIPPNMKVYSAHRLNITSTRGVISSCPNSRTASLSSLRSFSQELRPASDSNLHTVTVHEVINPSIEVTVPSDEEDITQDGKRTEDSLDNVTIAQPPQNTTSISISEETCQTGLVFVTSQN